MFGRRLKIFLFGFLFLAFLGGAAFWFLASPEIKGKRIVLKKTKEPLPVYSDVELKKRYWEKKRVFVEKKEIQKRTLPPITQVYRPALAKGEKPPKPKRILELEEALKKRPKNEKVVDTFRFLQREFPKN